MKSPFNTKSHFYCVFRIAGLCDIDQNLEVMILVVDPEFGPGVFGPGYIYICGSDIKITHDPRFGVGIKTSVMDEVILDWIWGLKILGKFPDWM